MASARAAAAKACVGEGAAMVLRLRRDRFMGQATPLTLTCFRAGMEFGRMNGAGAHGYHSPAGSVLRLRTT